MPRKIAVLAGFLAALTAAALLIVWRSGRVERETPLRGIKPGEAVEIILERDSSKIVFERKGGQWRLTAPVRDEADQGAVDDLASGLRALTLGSEVSREVDNYVAYDLNESSATRVRLFVSGRAAASLDGYFGKAGLGYDSLYFRFAGEKPVYLTTGVAAYRLNHGAEDFRQRALFDIDRDAILRISARSADSSFEIAKTSGGWTSTPKGLASDKTEQAVSKLAALRAASFALGAETSAETGFDKPLLSVEISGSVKAAKFTVGKPRVEKSGKPLYRYVRVDGRPAVLLVPAADVEAIIGLFGN